MRPNQFRQRLDAGLPTLGTHIFTVWPTVVEILGQSGHYDYVEFSGEYAPFTMHDLDNLGRAFEIAGLAGIIKVEQRDFFHQSLRAIGSGFQGILFADIRTVEDARDAVASVRAECPTTRRGVGLVGVGLRRDVGAFREAGSKAYVQALDDAVVTLMVEKRQCVENLEAILDVPGIDMVQFGPADYAMSIGHAGEWTHPAVKEAEEFMIRTALKKGVHPRVEIREPSQAAPFMEMGVKHFCMGWDVAVLNEYWRTNGEKMVGMLEGKATAATPGAGAAKGNYT